MTSILSKNLKHIYHFLYIFDKIGFIFSCTTHIYYITLIEDFAFNRLDLTRYISQFTSLSTMEPFIEFELNKLSMWLIDSIILLFVVIELPINYMFIILFLYFLNT